MGFLFAPSRKPRIPEVTGLQIQTAVNVLPIPICYGSPRIPMNIIYANGFNSVKQKSGGGKGLMGGKGEVTGYKYYATFIGALCEGEISNIGAMFENQAVYTVATLPPGKRITAFTGTPSQEAWSYIQSKWPDDAFGYKDTAYLGFENYEIDSSGTIPQMNFIVIAKFAASSPLNRYDAPDGSQWLFDADPALCIHDFLTHFRYGAGFPEAYIDQNTLWTSDAGFNSSAGDSALSTYCQAVGFGWSVVINNYEAASSILDRWCKNLVVAPVWTGEKLKFIPYCDSYVGFNPGYDEGMATVARKYYRPNIAPLFDLTDEDFMQAEEEDDPVVLTRVDVVDVKNTVRLNFRDRYNYFNDNVSEAKDELSSELYGPRVDRMGSADEFTHMSYASTASQLQLQRNVAIRRTATFRLGLQWCILEPMDIITITESTLGLVKFPVRIKDIEEDEKGILTIVAEEFPAGSMEATLYERQTNSPTDVFNTAIAPPPVNTPAIFEPTAELLEARSQPAPTVMIGVSGGPNGTYDPNWGGCEVWLSDDNVTYAQYGTINAPARTGSLTASLPAYTGASPDTVNTLSVSLAESNGFLESATDFQAMAGLTLCAIIEPDGSYELVGYVNAALSGTNAYNLTRLYRGMFGTHACQHTAGSKFVRVDSQVAEIALQTAFIGRTIYVKLPSFNIYLQGLEDISTVTAYEYTPAGYGIGVGSNQLAEDLQTGVTPIDLNSYAGSVVTLDLGAVAGECAPGAFSVDLENY